MSTEAVNDKEYDQIRYKQWTSTERYFLVEIVESIHQFIDLLCKEIVILTRHHFITKKIVNF